MFLCFISSHAKGSKATSSRDNGRVMINVKYGYEGKSETAEM